MTPALPTADELQRLEMLRRYNLLDSPPEQALDDLTALTARICEAPISLISLIDEDRQWFLSKFGLSTGETPRDISFCAHTIRQPDLFIVPDASLDERFADNPLVIGDPNIRCYAGAPLVSPSGHALGTLCIIDYVPRTLTPVQQEALRVLSRQVMAQLEIRRQTLELAASEERLSKVFRNGPVALAVHRWSDRTFLDVNAAFTALLGWTREDVVGRTTAELKIVEQSAAADLRSQLEAHLTLRNTETVARSRSGEILHILMSTEVVDVRGEQHAITTFIDVTERKRAEATLASTSATLTAVTEGLAAYVERGDWKEAMGRLLQCAIGQTQSEYGFIGVVVGSTLRVLAHEGIIWDKILNREFYAQALDNYETVGYLEFSDLDNLFGRAVTSRQVVIANVSDTEPGAKGGPVGHPPMSSFLGVPIFVGDQVHGVVALANRPGGYSENEQRQIETLVQHAGGLCTSYRQREAAAALEQERAQADTALKRAEGSRRAVWESSLDALITMDESGNITDFNPAAENIFGYQAADVIGHQLADKIIPPAMRERHRSGMTRFLSTGQTRMMGRRVEFSALRSDGAEFPVELTVATVAGAERVTFLGTVRDISQRKQAEEAFRASESKFRQLAESNILGLLFWDAQGNVTDGNDAFLKMVGYTREELESGRIDWRSLTPPEYLPHDQRALAEIAATGCCTPFEKEYFHKDGRRVAIMVGAAALDGAKDRGLCYVVDISQQKQAEAKVREAAQLANLRAEIAAKLTSPQALPDIAQGVCDMLVRHLGVAFARIWTLDKAEQTLELRASAGLYTHLDGPHARVPFGQYKVGRIAKNRKPHLTNDVPHDPEISDVAWAQREGMIAFAGYPLMIEGRVLGVLGMFSRHALSEQVFGDLPPLADWIAQCIQRKGDEAMLRVSEERFRLLAKATNDAIWDWNLVTDQVWWNEGYEKLFGYPRADYPSAGSWTDYLHPEDYSRVTEGIRRVIEHGGEDWSDEYRFRCKDGHYSHVLDRGHVIRDAAGKPVRMIGGMEDITEQRHLESQLRQSQKMEAIGQLAGGIAHDFNNILAVMMMHAELTGMVENLPSKAHDGLREIRSAAERAASLTRQLLLFSRKQVMQSRLLDLNEVVTGVATMLQRIIGEDVRQQLNLNPRPLITHADAGMLDQVLMNLVVNARDAMPGGGDLFIETSEHTFTAPEAATIPEAIPGRYVCLRVTDTGSGMSPEVLSRIFEPFFTTKEPGKGTGLGLATVFGIAKQHNGVITVDSAVGKGTTFRLFLRAEEVTAKPRAAEAEKPLPGPGTETILLVEDEPSVRMLTRVVLERSGYQVLEAAHGVEALKIWAREAENIQLLLTDIVMPEGISGRELAARFREKKPRLRVIFTSGYSADIAGRELSLQEGQNFIQKPASRQQLLETVRRCLDT